MRLGTKIVLVAVVVLAGWFLFAKTFDYLKEKYFYKFVANGFHTYAEKKWGADLYVGDVEGSILKDISLKNIAADRIKNLPAGFQIKADSLDLTYPPFGLLFGRFDGKFENLHLIYKDAVIPIDAYQHDGLAIIVIKKNSVNLSKLSDMLPQGSLLSGTVDTEGEIILKRLKLHLVNISFNSKDFQLDSKPYRKMKGAFEIGITGKAGSPQITGSIKIRGADIDGGFSFLSGLEDLKFADTFASRSMIDIDIAGKNITAANKYMKSDLNVSVKLKKVPEGSPRIFGAIVISRGVFRFYENQFRMAGGKITFGQMSNKPLFDINGEINVGPRKIFAKIKGSENIRVTLSSVPEMPYSEIASLLLFRKETKDLSGVEKDRLTRVNFNDSLVTSLFSF